MKDLDYFDDSIFVLVDVDLTNATANTVTDLRNACKLQSLIESSYYDD